MVLLDAAAAKAGEAQGEAEDGTASTPLQRRHWLAGGLVRTRTIRSEIEARDTPNLAMMIAILALLPRADFSEPLCRIRTDGPRGDANAAKDWPKQFPDSLPGMSGGTVTDPRKLIDHLARIDGNELGALFAACIGDRCFDVPYEAKPGAIPETLGLGLTPADVRPDAAGMAAHLALYTRAQLMAVAKNRGVSQLELAGRSAKDAAEWLAAHPELADWTPPELRLLSADDASAAAAEVFGA